MVELVDTTPLRDAFLKCGLSAQEVARNAGWWRNGETRGDGSRVVRMLRRERVRYETAVVLVRAMDVDPVDVGV